MGIRLWDSLEFAKSEKSLKIEHTNIITETSLTDHSYEKYSHFVFSLIFVMIMIVIHSHSNSNCTTPPNHRLSDNNFKNLELVCHCHANKLTLSIIKYVYHPSPMTMKPSMGEHKVFSNSYFSIFDSYIMRKAALT